jgi:hypothetical protein
MERRQTPLTFLSLTTYIWFHWNKQHLYSSPYIESSIGTLNYNVSKYHSQSFGRWAVYSRKEGRREEWFNQNDD